MLSNIRDKANAVMVRPTIAVETPKSSANAGRIGAITPYPTITSTVEMEIISNRSC